jgi:hypothetical protein
MTIGSENFGHASAKTDDRFGAQLGGYRGNGRRESNPLSGDHSIDDLGPRNGSGIDRITMPLSTGTALTDPTPIGASLSAPKLAEARLNEPRLHEPRLSEARLSEARLNEAHLHEPRLSELSEPSLTDLGSLSEPMFARDAWLDAPTGSLADHPLLRGLLLELPPKGTIPQQDWLDRWFEAARSILELLYSQDARS